MYIADRLRSYAVAWSCMVGFLLGGCSVPFPVYSISGSNVQAIRSLNATVRTGEFAGREDTVVCRLQPISPEGGVTFAKYIRKALDDELTIAGGTNQGRVVEVRASMVHIDVSCGIIDADWTIEMDVSVNGQPPQRIKTVRRFDGNYFGAVVATRAYQAFVPAVQQVVADILAIPAVREAGRP